AAREYGQALAETNSYVLESLRGLKDTLQYQDTAARAEGITAHTKVCQCHHRAKGAQGRKGAHQHSLGTQSAALVKAQAGAQH
ncbi:hypothetical protein ACSTB0_13665, partial [Faecalibacterium wellingii]